MSGSEKYVDWFAVCEKSGISVDWISSQDD